MKDQQLLILLLKYIIKIKYPQNFKQQLLEMKIGVEKKNNYFEGEAVWLFPLFTFLVLGSTSGGNLSELIVFIFNDFPNLSGLFDVFIALLNTALSFL